MSIISESKTRQVQTLNELSKRKVVEHNSLITSIAKMDKTPLKMFELAVSLIDTDNPPKDQTVYLSKKEMFAFFKVDDNDKHSRFKEAIEKILSEKGLEPVKKSQGVVMKEMMAQYKGQVDGKLVNQVLGTLLH